MTMRRSKFTAIAFVLTAAAACTQPESGNNHQATDIQDASNATTPPPDDATIETYQSNNKTFDASNNATNNIDNGTTPPQ